MKTLKPSCRKASIRALRRVRRSTWCQSAPTSHRSPTPASCNRSPAMATTSSSLGRSPKVSMRGRYVWQNITFLHSKTQAVTIGRQQFKDLCVATGISEQVTDVEIFKYIPCRLKVGIEKDKQGVYPDKNRVSRILPLEPRIQRRPRLRRSRHRGRRRSGNDRADDGSRSLPPPAPTARRRPGVSKSRRSPKISTTRSRTVDHADTTVTTVRRPPRRRSQPNRTNNQRNRTNRRASQ